MGPPGYTWFLRWPGNKWGQLSQGNIHMALPLILLTLLHTIMPQP